MQCIINVSDTGNKNDEEQFAVFEYDDEYEKKEMLKMTFDEIAEDFSDAEELLVRIVSD